MLRNYKPEKYFVKVLFTIFYIYFFIIILLFYFILFYLDEKEEERRWRMEYEKEEREKAPLIGET